MKIPGYFPRLFWFLIILKLISGTFFASEYVTKGFIPFIRYFLETGLNPYDYFRLHVVFPYPSGMLYVFSFPITLAQSIFLDIFSLKHTMLLLMRLPILLADITIYITLCKLLPSKEKKVLLLYFASPVLFYINYFHGQLDVVPTAFLFVTLYFLFFKRYML